MLLVPTVIEADFRRSLTARNFHEPTLLRIVWQRLKWSQSEVANNFKGPTGKVQV
jgi:hypothetical protein